MRRLIVDRERPEGSLAQVQPSRRPVSVVYSIKHQAYLELQIHIWATVSQEMSELPEH